MIIRRGVDVTPGNYQAQVVDDKGRRTRPVAGLQSAQPRQLGAAKMYTVR